MKKQNLNTLKLNKVAISKFVNGGKARPTTTLVTMLSCSDNNSCNPPCNESIFVCNSENCTLTC